MGEFAVQTEALLLGAVLDGGPVSVAAEHVTADAFTAPSHRVLWELMVDLDREGRRPTTLEVLNELARRNLLDRVGGPVPVHDLAAVGLGSDTARRAREVAEETWRRRAQDAARRLYEAASDRTQDPAAVLAAVTGELEQSSPAPERLPLYQGGEILQVPAPEWLVEGVVAEGLAMVVGPYSSGKSMVTIDIALCVANGHDWWGAPTRTRRVLYVAAEGVSGVARRMDAWVQTHHGTTLDRVALYGAPLNIHRPRDAARLDTLVRKTGAELLVLDTWARMTSGADENDNGQAGAAVEVLDRLRARRGCDVWVVHHTGTDGERPRGATSLPGAADTGVMVRRDGKTTSVSCFKQKDAEEFTRRQFVIAPHESGGATLQRKVDAGSQTRSTSDWDRAEALERVRQAPQPRALLERDYGLDTVRSLLAHPEVTEGRDREGRRVLAGTRHAAAIDPITAV